MTANPKHEEELRARTFERDFDEKIYDLLFRCDGVTCFAG